MGEIPRITGALFDIKKKLVNPIRLDFSTGNMTKSRYARVCVEVELIKPLTTNVWVEKHWQEVEYENLQLICFSCGRIGHRKDQCNYGGEKERKEEDVDACNGRQDMQQPCKSTDIGRNTFTGPVLNDTRAAQEVGRIFSPMSDTKAQQKLKEKDMEDYGPWMIVNNSKKQGPKRDLAVKKILVEGKNQVRWRLGRIF